MKRSREGGFTLVETMAAVGVFAIITLGTVPLLVTAVRGVDLSRRLTVAKTLAQEAHERARGLPYFVSYASQNSAVDVLDLYYPSYQASGTYTTVCTPSTVNRACPADIPPGYTVTFEASFVNGVIGADGKEDFVPVVPPTNYAWNGADNPAADLLRLSIEEGWSQAGRARSFELGSIIGDRKFTSLKVSGSAKVEHGIGVLTQYAHPAYGSGLSALNLVDGAIDAEIESKELSKARLALDSATIRLDEVLAATGSVGAQLGSADGASIDAVAPPSQTPANPVVDDISVTHPAYSTAVAGADTTTTENLQVSVTSELPVVRGTYYYAKDNGERDIWAMADLDEAAATALRLDATRPMVYARPWNDGNNVRTLRGAVLAETTALTSGDRKVRTNAATETRYLAVLPTTYAAPTSQGSFQSVLIVDSFTASVDCKATGNAATATATTTWSATIRYYRDSNPADNIPSGSYVDLNAGGALTASNFSSVMTTLGNPLVYDGAIPADDIYLFEDAANGRVGYLRSFVTAGSTVSTSDGGRVATASLPGAIVVETAPVDPAAPDSTLSISMGNLSCEAVDRR
ncbi:MAG: prepilin-type N-terminal cleavage/methylation domain-containing protein [Actinomycetota bacterium]